VLLVVAVAHGSERRRHRTAISAAGDCRPPVRSWRNRSDHPPPQCVKLTLGHFHVRKELAVPYSVGGAGLNQGYSVVQQSTHRCVKGSQGLSVSAAQRTNAGTWKSSCQRAAGRRSLSFVNWSRFDTREATEEDVKAFRETPFAKSFLALFDHIVKERLKGPTQSPSIRIKEQVDLDASSTNNAVGGARSVGRSRWGPARPSRPIRWQWNHQPADQKLFSSPI
jgi:hypothetical protein